MCAVALSAMSRAFLFSSLLALALVGGGCASVSSDDVAQGENDLEASDPLAKIRAAVKDVDQEHVVFADDVKAPIDDANGGTSVDLTTRAETGAGAPVITVSLYGVDWFQKWGGSVSADHTWSNGTPEGQRCMWASVARFDAIMKSAPELKAFLADYTKWSGRFYNWNNDYSGKSPDGEPAVGDAKGARLWAWQTALTKWISATAKDGSCYLPTRKMLVSYLGLCKTQIASNDGEMQGCDTDTLSE